MRGILKELLNEMKNKVVNNLEIIKNNENEVKRFLVEPYSEAKNTFLQESFSANRDILNINMDYLELQLKIVGFMSKYSKSDLIKLPLGVILEKSPSNIDFFEETIKGRFEFNEYHPYYRNEEFIERLIIYYTENERFEECERLAKIKREIFSL